MRDPSAVMAVCCLNAALAVGSRAQVQFTVLGVLPGQPASSGEVVNNGARLNLGSSLLTNYWWTPDAGMHPLGLPHQVNTPAAAANAQVLVGQAWLNGVNRAFRWTPDGGIQDLGTLGGDSDARAVSADGSVVVGRCLPPGNPPAVAFVWTSATGMQPIGAPDGVVLTPMAVSADGTAVAGYGAPADRFRHAYRWTAATGWRDLGIIATQPFMSIQAMTADGVAVGQIDGLGAFRWSPADGLLALDDFGAEVSSANRVSQDGETVIGHAWNSAGTAGPFRWTRRHGSELLSTILARRGVDLGGWTISFAQGMSPDGRCFTGEAYKPGVGTRAYLLAFVCGPDVNADGIVDLFDYADFTADFEAGAAPADFNRDGFLDFFDYLDFVAAFESGC